MRIQPNVVVGVVGLVVALVTGTVIAANWQGLTGLEHYEASFVPHHQPLPERSRSLPDNGQRNETYFVPQGNLTLLSVDLTWQETLSRPEVTARVFDPQGQLRAQKSQVGGIAGIHLDVAVLKPSEIPEGNETFSARGDDLARQTFETRWPAHPESRGNWTVLISSRVSGPATPVGVQYNLHVEYDWYGGTYVKIEPSRGVK